VKSDRLVYELDFEPVEYGANMDSDSTVRFRNRLEFLVPLNTERITDDGARYLLTDWEWFMPIDDPEERFANSASGPALVTVAASTGEYELLYIWTRSRDALDAEFSTNEDLVDVRVKRVF